MLRSAKVAWIETENRIRMNRVFVIVVGFRLFIKLDKNHSFFLLTRK